MSMLDDPCVPDVCERPHPAVHLRCIFVFLLCLHATLVRALCASPAQVGIVRPGTYVPPSVRRQVFATAAISSAARLSIASAMPVPPRRAPACASLRDLIVRTAVYLFPECRDGTASSPLPGRGRPRMMTVRVPRDPWLKRYTRRSRHAVLSPSPSSSCASAPTTAPTSTAAPTSPTHGPVTAPAPVTARPPPPPLPPPPLSPPRIIPGDDDDITGAGDQGPAAVGGQNAGRVVTLPASAVDNGRAQELAADGGSASLAPSTSNAPKPLSPPRDSTSPADDLALSLIMPLSPPRDSGEGTPQRQVVPTSPPRPTPGSDVPLSPARAEWLSPPRDDHSAGTASLPASGASSGAGISGSHGNSHGSSSLTPPSGGGTPAGTADVSNAPANAVAATSASLANPVPTNGRLDGFDSDDDIPRRPLTPDLELPAAPAAPAAVERTTRSAGAQPPTVGASTRTRFPERQVSLPSRRHPRDEDLGPLATAPGATGMRVVRARRGVTGRSRSPRPGEEAVLVFSPLDSVSASPPTGHPVFMSSLPAFALPALPARALDSSTIVAIAQGEVQRAVLLALAHSLTLLQGGPGTGKTQVAAQFARVYTALRRLYPPVKKVAGEPERRRRRLEGHFPILATAHTVRARHASLPLRPCSPPLHRPARLSRSLSVLGGDFGVSGGRLTFRPLSRSRMHALPCLAEHGRRQLAAGHAARGPAPAPLRAARPHRA